jgi:hypothetical protein
VRAIELLARHFGKFPLFVLKDPRFSILVPFWVSVLEEMGVRPVFVITSRNPAEVAGSLAHRDRFPIEKTELLWLMHTLAAEKSTRGKPRVFIDYAQLLDNWKDCAARIGKALGVEWPTSIDAAAPKIDAMLCPDLRHQCAAGDELTSTSAWVSRTYEAIRAATRGDESQLAAILDEIGGNFDIALAGFGPLLAPSSRPRINSDHHALLTELQRVEREGRDADEERAAIAKIAAGASSGSHIGMDQLVPVRGTSRSSDGSWHGSGSPPRFVAAVSLPAGKARIRAMIRSSVWSRAAICLDYGRGFIDSEQVELAPLYPGEIRIERILSVYQPCSLVRFDPAQDAGDFALLSFVLEPAPASYDDNTVGALQAGDKWAQLKQKFPWRSAHSTAGIFWPSNCGAWRIRIAASTSWSFPTTAPPTIP